MGMWIAKNVYGHAGIEVASTIFIQYGGQDIALWHTQLYAKLQILKSDGLTIYYRLSPGVCKAYLLDAYGRRFYLNSTMDVWLNQ